MTVGVVVFAASAAAVPVLVVVSGRASEKSQVSIVKPETVVTSILTEVALTYSTIGKPA